MTTHELKTWPVAFQMAHDGVKMFEIRVNDRNFQVGDTLNLREWNHENGGYSGRELWREVTCVVTGWGIPDGMCVLGLQELFGDALSAPAQPAQVTDDDVREKLAALAHEMWSGWMEYMFSKSIEVGDGCEEIPAELVKRWKRQIDTAYSSLPENEKESDRVEADKMLSIIRRRLSQPAPSDAKECECCEFKHGISSFIPAVFCGLCKHPILNPKGERLYASFESVDAWQHGRELPQPALPDAVRAVVELKDKHSQTWRDKPESYWFARLSQEVGELGSALVGDHDDPPEWELKQIAAICLNWLEMRAAVTALGREKGE